MKLSRKSHPLLLIIGGLIGLSLFLAGDHYHLAIIPTSDFAKGIWFGVCLGLELTGGFLLLRSKVKSAT